MDTINSASRNNLQDLNKLYTEGDFSAGVNILLQSMKKTKLSTMEERERAPAVLVTIQNRSANITENLVGEVASKAYVLINNKEIQLLPTDNTRAKILNRIKNFLSFYSKQYEGQIEFLYKQRNQLKINDTAFIKKMEMKIDSFTFRYPEKDYTHLKQLLAELKATDYLFDVNLAILNTQTTLPIEQLDLKKFYSIKDLLIFLQKNEKVCVNKYFPILKNPYKQQVANLDQIKKFLRTDGEKQLKKAKEKLLNAVEQEEAFYNNESDL